MGRPKIKDYTNIGLRVDSELWNEFRQCAEEHRMTYTAALEWAMERFIETEKRKTRADSRKTSKT